jgi:hypothetical protein
METAYHRGCMILSIPEADEIADAIMIAENDEV